MSIPVSLSTKEPLNKVSTAQLELSVCDEDIKNHFGATEEHEECIYVPGLPGSIQTIRLLRDLIDELKISNNRYSNTI